MKKSEQMQSIYRMHTPTIDTKFGKRAMTEIGVIKDLEIKDAANYVLIPLKRDGELTTGWSIHKLSKNCEIKVVNFGDLDSE